MKKGIIVCVLLIIIGVIIVLMMPKEHYIKEEKELYEKAINYLDEEEYKVNEDSKKDKFKFFISYDGFGMTEKGENKFAYMWILGEGYYLEGDKREPSRSYSMFFKFTFKDGKVVSYENATDASEYTISLKRMCIDQKMVNKVLNYKLSLNNDEKVNEYYSKI